MHAAMAIASLIAVLALGPGVGAHEHQHDHDAALGDVQFAVSCNPEAQKRFNTAASLLYSFYWERIDSAVAYVIAAEPVCEIAQGVKAVASIHNALG
jgi:hypothetical protein